MSFYFHPSGAVNLRALTFTSSIMLGLYSGSFWRGISQGDEGMTNLLKGENQHSNESLLSRLEGWLVLDKVMYSKMRPDRVDDLRGKVVAIKDPFNPGLVVYRRVVATEHLWVRRYDTGTLIQIPKGHVWVECTTPNRDSCPDSISTFGPISVAFVLGEVTHIIFPPWRA